MDVIAGGNSSVTHSDSPKIVGTLPRPRLVLAVAARADGGVDSEHGHMSRKIRKSRTDKFDTLNKRNFPLVSRVPNSCKRLVPSVLHELHEWKFPFVSRIEFILSLLSNFSAHVCTYPGIVRGRGGAVSRGRGDLSLRGAGVPR